MEGQECWSDGSTKQTSVPSMRRLRIMNSKRLLFPVGAAFLLMCSIGSPSSAPAITIEFNELPLDDFVTIIQGISND